MNSSRLERRGDLFILHLFNDFVKPTRTVGKLVGDELIIRKQYDQFFEKHHSYGFNREMVETTGFKILRMRFPDGKELITTKEFLLAKGIEVQEGNLDAQIHLPLRLFGLDKARAWESKKKQLTPYERLLRLADEQEESKE